MEPKNASEKPEMVLGGNKEPLVQFGTSPDEYKHWKLTINGNVAHLSMAVDEAATLKPGYELKLNSYDLGVDGVLESYQSLGVE